LRIRQQSLNLLFENVNFCPMKNILPSNEPSVRSLPRNSVGCALLLLLTTVSGGQGIAAQVDQENWDLTPTSIFSAVQQEFTPALDTLDSVQLLLSNQAALGFPGGAMQLRIRADGPSGPIVAASQPTYVAPFYEGPVGFGFAVPVSLVPGRVYVLEPFNNIAAAPFGVTPPRYSGGQFFANFQPAEYDLIFREGIGLDIVPEPSPGVLFAAGLVSMLGVLEFRARRCETRRV
jgi:hypothetical protein